MGYVKEIDLVGKNSLKSQTVDEHFNPLNCTVTNLTYKNYIFSHVCIDVENVKIYCPSSVAVHTTNG